MMWPGMKHRNARTRRSLVNSLLGVLVCIGIGPILAVADAPKLKHVSVDAIEIPVSDLQRSVAFYQDILTFKGPAEPSRDRSSSAGRVMLHLGAERVILVESHGRPVPTNSRSHDRWFQHLAIVTSDMDHAYKHLREHRVHHVSGGPQRLPDWNSKAAGIRAFYFQDPDQHTLEVIQFPKGKGNPRWQESNQGLFLGIDHTAIVVASTETSMAYYRDRLGFELAGESENFGEEQDRLNNVFNARLRITSLKARSGPGVELLEYLSPTDGREYPTDSRSDDLWCWKTRLLVPDTSTTSPGVLEQTPTKASAASDSDDGAGIVSDPDGHRLQVVVRSKEEHHVQEP